MLTIFYGRENVDKEKFIFDNIDPKGRALIIVPDQFTLEAEREIFAHFGVDGLMDIEVISMSRLGSRLLAELGGSKRTFIDKYGRHMLLSRIAGEERENLLVFRGLEKKSSFIDLVNNFISELKQYNCGAEELLQIADRVEEGSYVQKKLQDLHLLYSRYEAAIEGKYTDSEDYIDLFLGKINQSELIRGNVIWIYGFDSFAPKALSVIGELMSCAEHVNVVLTYSNQPGDSDKELFALTEKVMNNLRNQCSIRNQTCTEERIPAKYSRAHQASAMALIESQLYAVPGKTAENANQAAGLTMVTAANLYNEAESAASFVLKLVREEGYRYSDIKVICNDQETRGPIIRRVFKEYGMDLFSDSGRDIMQNPVIRFVISLLDVVVEKYRTEAVFRVLKSGFADLASEEITDLENYAVKYRIKGTMWKKHFVKGEKEYGLDELGRLEELRRRAAEPLTDFEKTFKAETNGQFIEALYKYLYDEAGLPDKIIRFMAEQETSGRLDLAEETSQVWGSLVGILDQLAEITGDYPFEGRDFAELLKVGLSQVEIGVLPPTKDGLMMGTMQRSRTGKIKALVVVGANEGLLPQEKTPGGLFGAEEKELFSECGVEICKVDSVRLMEERLAIYRNLSKPSEHLYISYSAADGEGGLSRPSAVFGKLQEIFPQVEVERDVLNRRDGKGLINGAMSGLRHMAAALQMVCEGEDLPDEWEETLSWYKENRPEKLATIGSGMAFSNKQEELGCKAADALFKKDPKGALSLSPSRLERFSRCPFSHFVLYGLKPEERRIFEIAPREIGDIYHECLMHLTRRLTKAGTEITAYDSPWMTITEEECREFAAEVVNRQAENYREGLFRLGNEENYRTQRVIDICQKVCWVVIEQVRAGQIKDCRFEVAFGRGKDINPVEVELEGQTAYLEGKIDRVDYLAGDRVKIIDYKTGNESFDTEEAKAGYRLQLMLYLAASMEGSRKPAGVFYFNISEPLIEASAKEFTPEEIAEKVKKAFKLNGVIVDDPAVIHSVAGDFSGYSDILPLRNTKDKGIVATGKDGLLTEEEFAELQEAVGSKVVEICQNLADGNIDIHPMKTRERSACTYCQYKGICRFDTIFDGCKYNII
ncbi:MAG: PD-(D/E)XK nuclease family protein [Firmicutes bacterium]|nr:PD-(D/E)XK nuclease family protein [Bacillota bacterium]